MTTTTMIAPDLKLIVKIEKLMAQAEDTGCTTAEREAFHNAALRLMAKYRIDRSMIGGNLAADDVLGEHEYGDINVGPYVSVLGDIVAAVANGYDSKILWRNRSASSWGTEKARRSVIMYGWKSDADLIRPLAERLLVDAQVQALGVKGYSGAETVSLRRAFLFGYASEIRRRMNEAAIEARSDAIEEGIDVASTDMVLVDRRKQMNTAFNKLRLRTVSTNVSSSGEGFSKGQAAGRAANLSNGSNAVSSTKAISR